MAGPLEDCILEEQWSIIKYLVVGVKPSEIRSKMLIQDKIETPKKVFFYIKI